MVLVQKQGSKYISHISLTSSTAINIFNENLSISFWKYNTYISNVKLNGWDETVFKTGCKTGVIKILKDWKKSLQ